MFTLFNAPAFSGGGSSKTPIGALLTPSTLKYQR
jgi:hypothetical protein